MAEPTMPQSLDVVVVVGAHPVPGALIEVELPMRRKNTYRFPMGPADSSGRLHVTGDQLERWTLQINALFLMDYVGLDAGWTGEVILRPVGRGGIERLRQAHSTWGHTGLYPPDFLADLARLEHALAATDDALPIEVTVEPGHDGVSTRTSFPG